MCALSEGHTETGRSPVESWWASHALPLDEIRSCVDTAASDPRKVSSFTERIAAETERIGEVVLQKWSALTDALEQLLRQIGEADGLASSADVDALAAELIAMDAFMRASIVLFDEVFEYHDDALGATLAPALRRALAESAWTRLRLGSYLSGLSAAYHGLRVRGDQGWSSPSATVWIPPSSFCRQTRKYLVRPEHVLRFKCALLRHLPLSVHGEDPLWALREVHRGGRVADELSSKATQRVSSTYLDSRGTMRQYHERLRRDDRAQLLRLRWYGTGARESPNTTVYVERKIHREDWTNERSAKDRYAVRGDRATALLSTGAKSGLEAEISAFATERHLEPKLRLSTGGPRSKRPTRTRYGSPLTRLYSFSRNSAME